MDYIFQGLIFILLLGFVVEVIRGFYDGISQIIKDKKKVLRSCKNRV